MSLTTAQRDRLAEALSWISGEMTRYSDTAVPDHNRWSWHGGGHSDCLRRQFIEQAEALAPVVADLLAAETARADKAEAAEREMARGLDEQIGHAEAAQAEADRLRAELDEHRAHYVSHEAYADAQAALGRCRELAEALDPEHDGHDFTHGHPDCTGCIHADLVAAIGGEA